MNATEKGAGFSDSKSSNLVNKANAFFMQFSFVTKSDLYMATVEESSRTKLKENQVVVSGRYKDDMGLRKRKKILGSGKIQELETIALTYQKANEDNHLSLQKACTIQCFKTTNAEYFSSLSETSYSLIVRAKPSVAFLKK